MTYPYQKITPTISRPLIQVVLKSQDKFVIYPVLIDSGADYCIFSIELVAVLGIKLSQKYISFRGIGNDKVVGFWGGIEIVIGKAHYRTKAIFAEISQFGHGILGQQGFFDHFDVNLSYKNQTIEIKPMQSSKYN